MTLSKVKWPPTRWSKGHFEAPGAYILSGQITTTSAEVTLNGGLVGESPQHSLNSGVGIIVFCPDVYTYIPWTHPTCFFWGWYGLTFHFMGQIFQNMGPHLGSRYISINTLWFYISSPNQTNSTLHHKISIFFMDSFRIKRYLSLHLPCALNMMKWFWRVWILSSGLVVAWGWSVWMPREKRPWLVTGICLTKSLAGVDVDGITTPNMFSSTPKNGEKKPHQKISCISILGYGLLSKGIPIHPETV